MSWSQRNNQQLQQTLKKEKNLEIKVKFEQCTMACKLRKAIGAMKDQTSIGLAKVSSAANLEVNILKATTHDEIPMENRYVNEIVLLVSSNKVYAAACAQAIGKRIGRTRNWVVALKSLMLVLRIFQDGDPYFPREIFHAMKRGAKILNLSNFKDDSTPNSWDYTSFIRTFALYLYERLDCFLTGKLQRRFRCYLEGMQKKNLKYSKVSNEPGIKGLKPTLVLDRITYWQNLLDRAIGSRPTGAAKKKSLIKISLYAIVQESFDLYRDISDGLSVILDSFFELPYKSCVTAFKACVKSSTQFDELSRFYAFCASLGIGRKSEYPSVQKVSNEIMETLREFLEDQASFSTTNGQPRSPLCDSKHNLLPPLPKGTCSISSQDEANEQPGAPSKSSEHGSQCSSLEGLLIVTTDDADLSLGMSLPIDQTRTCFDLVILDDFQQVEKRNSQAKEQDQQNATLSSNQGSTDCWDLVLAEITSTPMKVEQQNSQVRDQEQKDTTSSSKNGSTDCWDLVLAEISFTPKQVEQHNSQTRDQEQKNTTSSLNNGSTDKWDLVLAEIASTTKQGEQHNGQTSDKEQKNTSSCSKNGSLDCWDLVLAEISSASKQVNQHVSKTRDGSKDCWDLVFAGIGTKSEGTSTNKMSNGIDSSILDLLFDQPSSIPQAQCNPFLENTTRTVPSTTENYKAGFANLFDPAPTFQGSVPMVSAQNPLKVAITPTSTGQCYNSQASLAQIHCDLNAMKTSPTFTPQDTSRIRMVAEPTFHAQSLKTITTEPAFHIAGSYKIGSTSPTFHAHNETSTAPTTLSSQNVNMAMTIPTLAPQNANKTMASSPFWAQDFDGAKSEASTYCEKNCNETTMTTTDTKDDPFEAWMDAMTKNRQTSSELKQERSSSHQSGMFSPLLSL